MNKMKLPGFTAEASLYRSRGYYQSARNVRGLIGRLEIVPAMSRRQFICHMNCESGDSICHAQCDLMGGGGGGGGGGSGGGGGGQSCRPTCGPCQDDPRSPTGESRTCVRSNCSIFRINC
jgi:hypothetical protein